MKDAENKDFSRDLICGYLPRATPLLWRSINLAALSATEKSTLWSCTTLSAGAIQATIFGEWIPAGSLPARIHEYH